YECSTKLNITVASHVRWNCRVYQSVLLTTLFIKLEALIMPPVSPGINQSIPINGARKRTSFHGSFLSHPNIPLSPSSRPLASNVANIEKAVINDGMTTKNVKMTCKYFQKGSIPGSVNW